MIDPIADTDLRLRLYLPLRWLVMLRWLVAAAVLAGGLLNAFLLHWYPQYLPLLLCGLFILAYNVMLWRLQRLKLRPMNLVSLAWFHILADLVLLTLLVLCTGKAASPLVGFYVFHMVFASLLLSPLAAYGCAAIAIALFAGCLLLMHDWPGDRAGLLALAGWSLTLVFTVYLTSRITGLLRRNYAQLQRRSRRVRDLLEHLRRQQDVMIQHEKSVTMGHMAAGVAHEIANPLASMDSLLQLMQRSPKHLTPDKIDLLRQQIDRIKIIVRQMTDFAHPTEYQWKTLPINELIESGLELVRFDRRLGKIKLERQLCSRNCPVRVQAHAVQQVMVNVIVNALDALQQTPDPCISIRTECDGHGPSIYIADNGPGISASARGELFEPFFTTKPVGQGTGLGLTICSRLMRQQGGYIELTDTTGRGATFHIKLPPPPEVKCE
ncbi:MAG: hypothetical protein IT445_05360 [Phycisphaeraceae bacterium]|nr:hypothetical protein [Phycisphaeraceae bacterium]